MSDTHSRALRRAFVDYFVKHGHEAVPSGPLVPQHDPTLMFVNAGMVPFKDVFTGKDERPYTRATSSQKCIRISGKHNDLENVGVTARHHTFFEMLGNFSFGDYFKEEAIVRAWDLLTRELGVEAKRMVITVFKGEGGFAADDEAAALWRKVTGFGDDRILRLGMADNFWSMGPTGPCGPCSEIHYFHGDVGPGGPDVSSFGDEPAMDGSGWVEIWNLVFMQYDRAHEGADPIALPAPSIDTGAGLERLAGVLQNVSSNYDTDIMKRLIVRIADIAGKRYTAGEGPDDVSMRVIADHARTTAFLISEGIMPDKQRREYVLRRVMRRAIRHGHRLGIGDLFLHEVALEVVDAMGEDYPELVERKQMIARVTEGEEARFRATLRRGMKILDERFSGLDEGGVLSAETTADLYTTYGFPLDLTGVIAAEQGFEVDLDGARRVVEGEGGGDDGGPIDPNAELAQAYRDVVTRAGATEFIGYDHEAGESEVKAILSIAGGVPMLVDSAESGSEIEIVVASSPFYAESGGQAGDRGTICFAAGRLEVSGTYRKLGNVTLHRARVVTGPIRVGDAVRLEVDHAARTSTRRNHSATHLLHWALKEVVGEHAQQKGSLVGPDILRFDFAHNQPLSSPEMERIEDLVNTKILTNAPVQTDVLGIAEARAKGAVAIFEEKYGDVVRVLTMTEDSVELCGGTHCSALGDIGIFKILSEGGTAAGVRRIVAATGHHALDHVRAIEREMSRAREAAKAHGSDLAEKIVKMNAHERALEKRVAELEKQLLEGGSSGGGIDGMLASAQQIDDVNVLAVRVADETSMANMRELAEKLRDKLGAKAVVLVAAACGDKAQLALMVSKSATDTLKAGALIKPIAERVGGRGGGRPDMAQAGGTDTAGIDDAVAALHGEVAAALGD